MEENCHDVKKSDDESIRTLRIIQMLAEIDLVSWLKEKLVCHKIDLVGFTFVF